MSEQETTIKGGRRDARLEAYLIALRARGNVGKAAQIAGMARSSISNWRKDPDFGEEFCAREKEAMEDWKDSLLEEAVTRARDGWHEPVIHKGEQMYVRNPLTGDLVLSDDLEPIPLTMIRKSDALLAKMLEAYIDDFKKTGTKIGIGVGNKPWETPDGAAKITIEFVESDGEGNEVKANLGDD